MVLGAPILLIATLIVGLLLQKSILSISIGSLLYSVILLISLNFEKKKKSDFLGTILYFVTFGISYLLVR